jgi:hypothetical protein
MVKPNHWVDRPLTDVIWWQVLHVPLPPYALQPGPARHRTWTVFYLAALLLRNLKQFRFQRSFIYLCNPNIEIWLNLMRPRLWWWHGLAFCVSPNEDREKQISCSVHGQSGQVSDVRHQWWSWWKNRVCRWKPKFGYTSEYLVNEVMAKIRAEDSLAGEK